MVSGGVGRKRPPRLGRALGMASEGLEPSEAFFILKPLLKLEIVQLSIDAQRLLPGVQAWPGLAQFGVYPI